MTETVDIIFAETITTANVEQTAYTVPSSPSTRIVFSLLNVCNKNTTQETFCIRVQKSGGNKISLYENLPILDKDTFEKVSGVTLGPGDIIYIEASNTNINFGGFGTKITV